MGYINIHVLLWVLDEPQGHYSEVVEPIRCRRKGDVGDTGDE